MSAAAHTLPGSKSVDARATGNAETVSDNGGQQWKQSVMKEAWPNMLEDRHMVLPYCTHVCGEFALSVAHSILMRRALLEGK